MVINIFCKLEKASYNIFSIRAVMVKSLYTLRLSSGYNDLLNSSAGTMFANFGIIARWLTADQ